jgi:hypothetical protein
MNYICLRNIYNMESGDIMVEHGKHSALLDTRCAFTCMSQLWLGKSPHLSVEG